MQIQLTRNTVVNKEARVIGDIIEVAEGEAKFLIAIGKAVPAEAVAPPPAVMTTQNTPAAVGTGRKRK
ncbi:MAG: hypothetical protein ACYC6A_00770 [Armatimonadota bacterium]